MKTLANCKPSEFVVQTIRIKKVVADWLDATKIIDILRTRPQFKILPVGASAEERAKIIRENAKIQKDQSIKNMSRIFDVALEENPEKTLAVMALCCFVEPANVDDHPMSYYLAAVNELCHDEAVVSFFSSLAQLGRTNTLKQ